MAHYNNTTIILKGTYYTGLYYDKESLCKVIPGEELILYREPYNPHDKNAISVYLEEEGIGLGYIPKKIHAPKLASILDRGSKYHCLINNIHGNANAPTISIVLTTYPIPKEHNDNLNKTHSISTNKKRNQIYDTPTGKRFQKIVDFEKWAKKQDNKGGIYIIWNRSGRGYIGQSKNIGQRWRNHRNDLNARRHGNPDLQEDWADMGPDEFHFDVLEDIPSSLFEKDIEIINRAEAFYIKEFDTFNNGYNKTPDGQGVNLNRPDRSKPTQEPGCDVGAVIPIHPTPIEDQVSLTKQTIEQNSTSQPSEQIDYANFFGEDPLLLLGLENDINHERIKAETPNDKPNTEHENVETIDSSAQPREKLPQPKKPPIRENPMHRLWYLLVFVVLAFVIIVKRDPGPQPQKPDPPIEQYEHYYRTHTVRKGESLSLIARKYGVDLQELITMNGIEDKDLIDIGMEIKIPQ